MPEETSIQLKSGLVPVGKTQAILMLEAGYLLIDLGQSQKAREVFNGVAALLPKSEVPQLAIGTLEFLEGRHDKALQAYRAAQKLAPRSALPRAHCGEILLFMGKPGEAEKELKTALQIEPDSDGAKFAQALLEAKNAGVLPPPNAKKSKTK